jgi:hypothetical protein
MRQYTRHDSIVKNVGASLVALAMETTATPWLNSSEPFE